MAQTWLDALPSHAVFRAGPSHSTSLYPGEQLPPSPGLSTVASFHGDESLLHSNGAASTSSLKLKHQATCVVRKTELLVAVASSIRLADLAQFKTRIEGNAASSAGERQQPGSWHDDSKSAIDAADLTAADYAGASGLGSFKTLATPAIDFEILSLVPSPSSRYVAAVGASQVVVIQVPRRGWSSLVGRNIECSQDPVGPFYHTRSSETIAKVSFHPWGVDDTTLLVLTTDGLLREYDILEDPEEPTQVFDFSQPDGQSSLPPVDPIPHRGVRYGLNSNSSSTRRREKSESATPTSRRTRSRTRSRSRSKSRATPSNGTYHSKNSKAGMFGDRDEASSRAVSFCVGQGESDWAPFTLFCLMQNGDMYCVCPYLPKKAQVPSVLLESLVALAAAKINHLSMPGPATQLSLYEKRELEAEYAAQLKFLQALVDQRSAPWLPNGETPSMEEDEDIVSVKYPAYLRRAPTRQGPFLLQPAPHELDSDINEPLASDLRYVLLEPESTGQDDETATPAISFLLMSYEDGKVDVCIDVARVEATWTRQDSDSSLPLPSLLVYESIDLMGSNRTPLSDGPVQLMSDPEYSDLVYAQHNLGTHTISLRPIRDLLTQGTSLTTTGLSTMVNTDTTSDVSWLLREGLERSEEPFLRDAVVGMAIVNDVYLGYVAIFLHANLHVTCIELALRSERPADLQHDTFAEDTSITALNITNTNAPPAYKAFAGAADFVLPDLLVNNSTSRKVSTRYASQAPSSSQSNRATRDARPTLDLTIESLRFVGETIESLDKNIRDLITAANAVQDRLGEQLEEIPRQVDKISQLEGSLESKTQDLDTTFVNRLEEVKRKQQAITSRADSILQRLIDSSQPELSVYEKAWIEELGRVQQAVGSLTDRKSLESRTERLKEQLDVLRPRLEEMARIKGAKNSFAERGRLGEAQRLRVEGTLAEESRLISEARQRIDRLQKKIVLATKSTLQTVV